MFLAKAEYAFYLIRYIDICYVYTRIIYVFRHLHRLGTHVFGVWGLVEPGGVTGSPINVLGVGISSLICHFLLHSVLIAG